MRIAQQAIEQLEREVARLEGLARTTLDGREADRLNLEASTKRAKLNRLRQSRTDGVRFG